MESELMSEGEKKERVPFVTYALLSVVVAVQFYTLLLTTDDALLFYEAYSLFPTNIFNAVSLGSLVTYIFLHGNWVHLFINCIALAGAGIIVERDIGHLRYLAAFMAAGFVAGLTYTALHPGSSVPLIGASGAVFGVIAILFLLMPFKITYALVIPLPSIAVGLMLSLVELYSLWVPTDVNIAHDAHIGGFVLGGIYAFILDKNRALKGLFIALAVLAVMYYIALYYGVI